MQEFENCSTRSMCNAMFGGQVSTALTAGQMLVVVESLMASGRQEESSHMREHLLKSPSLGANRMLKANFFVYPSVPSPQ